MRIHLTRARTLLFLFLAFTLIPLQPGRAVQVSAQAVEQAPVQAAASVGEARDYAALELHDRWDMNAYSDISQAINNSGQNNYLQNIQVKDGVFSATATGAEDAQFYALWPGYNTAILHGKTGHNYPIDARKYSCLYLAMQVEPAASGPGALQVFWFKDEKLNGAGGAWGFSTGQTLSPEWKLYGIKLAELENFQQASGTVPWTAESHWRGLRIDPTNQPNRSFQIDWIRLTDCAVAPLEIRRSGSRLASVWVQPDGTDRQIQVISNTTESVIQMDTQGLMPGGYTYLVKEGGNVVASGAFNVAPLPVAGFVRPSPMSGVDYATQSGNAWDFNDAADVKKVEAMDARVEGGLVKMTTPAREGDPVLTLNTPGSIPNASAYRYLSFRLYKQGAWQNVPESDIVRWGWTVPGSGGRASSICVLMSQDIPYDVGWNTYTIDLHQAFAGQAEEWAGDCSGVSKHWNSSLPVTGLRFDPNENTTGSNLYQELDWIRLTQVDRVTQGQVFPIQISLDQPASNLSEIRFYYTSDRNNPTQHPIGSVQGSAAGQEIDQAQLASQASRIYLPTIFKEFSPVVFPPVENGVNFAWNTSNVPPGEYFICARMRNAYQEVVTCSEAPVQVMGR